jgi:serine protease Do
MFQRVNWRAGVPHALLAFVVVSSLGCSAALAQAPAPPSQAADSPGFALPESYPWVRLAEALTPAVVNVRVVGETPRGGELGEEAIPEPFRRFLPPELRERGLERGPRQARGLSSGFVVDPTGYIVTNHHVVDGAKTIEVTFADGRKLTATRVGSDPETDLALLKVEATGLLSIPLGRSAELRVGEPVMAIGSAFGLDHTVTVGIISAKSRVIGAGRFDDFLQTDAAINPGNSGGPLINTRGEAVGIATAIVSRSGGFQGIGFAIPSDLARPILGQLRTAGRVTRGWLGVSIQPWTPELAKSFGLTQPDGVLVASVAEGSPAAQAGLKPGDVIMRYDGKIVDAPRALSTFVAETPVGRTVDVSIVRDGRAQPVQVTIGNLADDRQAAAAREGPAAGEGKAVGRLGLGLAPLTPDLARRLGAQSAKGVVVTEVRPGSPAAQAGLAEGDLIREVNRRPVERLEDVEKGLSQGSGRADQVLLRVERQGASRYVTIDIG